MGDRTFTLYGMLQDIIRKETRYLRHYRARVVVNIDPTRKGKVLVTCDELGWYVPNQGAWASPRGAHSLVVPNVGDYVELYFMGGDVNRPVYLSTAQEVTSMVPRGFSKPTDKIIYQNPLSGAMIKYDELLQTFSIKGVMIVFNDGTESFVKGTAFLQWLTEFVMTVFNAHTHPGVSSGGQSTGPPAPVGSVPTGILSTEVFGK